MLGCSDITILTTNGYTERGLEAYVSIAPTTSWEGATDELPCILAMLGECFVNFKRLLLKKIKLILKLSDCSKL